MIYILVKMQFLDESGVCKCHGKCLHSYEKRLKKQKENGKKINQQDGFVFYDASSDCMVYQCGKVKYGLVDHTKLTKEDKEVLEENGNIEYIKNTKWAHVMNKTGDCGWQAVVPAVTNKVIVGRATVKKDGTVKFRVSVHPSLGKNLTLEQRRKIHRMNEKKTKVAQEVIMKNQIDNHIEKQMAWMRSQMFR